MKQQAQEIHSSSDQQTIIYNEQRQVLISSVDKAPKFMTFNQHITYGYRLNYKNSLQILKSLFHLHNQTINIWTHLIGSIFVFGVIVSFFIAIDKAQVEYQLKKYQNNLNNQFGKLNNLLHRIENTIKMFENSQRSAGLQQSFERFQYQLRSQYKIITDSVKYQVFQIQKILKYEVQLTQEQRSLRQIIQNNLNQFQVLQKQFQSEIVNLLWQDLNDEIYKKAQNIQTRRKQIQLIQTDINQKVIQYLELQKQTPNPYGVPRWPILIFLFTATICLGFSASFHLFYPMSSKAFKYFRRFDYAGVILNIVGTAIPPFYYSFYCNLNLAAFYLILISLFGLILFLTLLGNWIHQKNNESYKPKMFGIFGFTLLVPYTHFMIQQIFFQHLGDKYLFSHSNFWWFISCSSYLVGLYIFIKKWPQSKYKEKFDFIGSSHQIWHFLCLCGVATTYIAININYQTRKSCPCIQKN